MPKFSIVMPCFNAEATLDSTIESVLKQSFGDWELICIDDSSTDWTPRLLSIWSVKDPRIKVHHFKQGRGPAAARNIGASYATGEILCFLDADDMWTPEKLSLLAKAYEDRTLDGTFGRVAFFNREGLASTMSTVPSGPLTIPMLLGENPICTMSNFSIRRPFFFASGGLTEGFVHNEDLEWFIRLVAMDINLQGLDEFHVWYRTAHGGLSSDLGAMAKARTQALKTARRLGFKPTPQSEAIYLRYLARRSLRLNQRGLVALRFVWMGLRQSPTAFLLPLHRGLATTVAAMAAPLLPNVLRLALFAK